MRGLRAAFAVVCLVFLGVASNLSAQQLRNGYYVAQFWVQLEPMSGGALPGPGTSSPGAASPSGSAGAALPSVPSLPPLQGKQAITEILKEARYVFSGMLYGFSFTYVPADSRRGVAGSFTLTPIAQIKWGDPHLKVLDTHVRKGRLLARVMYTLAPFQKVWQQEWDSNIFPTTSGRGEARYYLSYAQKMASYKDAIKVAIRDYLRRRVYNRPHRVVGRLVLRGNPYTVIDSGRYVTTVRVKLRIKKIVPYSIY